MSSKSTAPSQSIPTVEWIRLATGIVCYAIGAVILYATGFLTVLTGLALLFLVGIVVGTFLNSEHIKFNGMRMIAPIILVALLIANLIICIIVKHPHTKVWGI